MLNKYKNYGLISMELPSYLFGYRKTKLFFVTLLKFAFYRGTEGACTY